MAWLKSTPPGTAACCLANFGPENDDDPELTNDEGELEKEFDDPMDELDDENEFEELNEGRGENAEADVKEFVFEEKEFEEGDEGLPMMVWKCDGWTIDEDLLKNFSLGVPDFECADPDCAAAIHNIKTKMST